MATDTTIILKYTYLSWTKSLNLKNVSLEKFIYQTFPIQYFKCIWLPSYMSSHLTSGTEFVPCNGNQFNLIGFLPERSKSSIMCDTCVDYASHTQRNIFHDICFAGVYFLASHALYALSSNWVKSDWRAMHKDTSTSAPSNTSGRIRHRKRSNEVSCLNF